MLSGILWCEILFRKSITFFLYLVFNMIHRLFQPGYEQLQTNVLGNFCSKIYNVGLFPKTPESMPRTIESGRYAVGKSFTFSGKKIIRILWMAFCNAGTVTNLKTRELLRLLKWLQICTVVFSDGLAQL